MPPVRISQIAFCTNNIPETTRLLTTVFGFASSGGRQIWGERVARIQGLPTADATALSVWWLVGRQDFLQVELFTHTTPAQRPRTDGWRVNDIGWARWGVAVGNFDDVLVQLDRAGIATITAPATFEDGRHVCFVEPGTQVVVEIIEQSTIPDSDRERFYDLAPAVQHVSVSVTDLESSRALFLAAGLREVAPDTVHGPDHESLWGLAGAKRDVAVLTDGDILLELVHYRDPIGAARPSDHLLSDQGFLNIALGFRDRVSLVAAFDALMAEGCTTGNPLPDVAGGTYLTTPELLSIELLLAPRELDADYGFTPMRRLPAPLAWPSNDSATGAA